MVVCAGLAAPPALADGDPASDVLAFQPLFLPVDMSPSPQTQELQTLLRDGDRAGFPIRVALINSAGDLGTVTRLWQQPGAYAKYLGLELSDLYGGQLLVVMPNGFGLNAPSRGPHAATAAELAVKAPTPGPGAQLVTSALAAVRALASAAGHPLPAIGPEDVRGGQAHATGGGTDVAALVVFVAGLLAIAAAWGLSISRRPLQLRRRASA